MIVVVVFLVGVFGCFSKQKHRRSRTKSKVIVSTDQERLKVICSEKLFGEGGGMRFLMLSIEVPIHKAFIRGAILRIDSTTAQSLPLLFHTHMPSNLKLALYPSVLPETYTKELMQ